MKPTIPAILFVICTCGFAIAQELPLDSEMFLQSEKEVSGSEVYACISIRRGDRITLTGSISEFTDSKGNITDTIVFTSEGGRVFLLKGTPAKKLRDAFTQPPCSSDKITVKGTVLFEGREDIPAELELTSFNFTE